MPIFLSWVLYKGKEAILNGVHGWGVGGTHRSSRVVHGLTEDGIGRREHLKGIRSHNNMTGAILQALMH